MVALKTSDIDAFVARPDPSRPIVLVFGPDAGLVRERAAAIVAASVDNPDDPFSLARLDGDDLSSDPLRLVEEANTIPLFGGRRAVWLKLGSRNIVPAVEALLAAPSPECRVVIEAGDLKRNAPLRVLCERAKNAAALPCYSDSERDLVRLIDDEMRQSGLAIAPEARAALMPFLGGDRQASRNEIRKLALYAHGRDRVVLEDVLAVVADASALALDGVVDAAFAGRLAEVETLYGKARAAGAAPGAIVSAALRQVAQLHKVLLAIEDGAGTDQAIGSLRPPAHFRRKPLIEVAVKAWSAQRLLGVMAQLNEAVLQTRRQPDSAETIAQRTLMSVAMAGRRKN
jgi:DNA polymerase III subunit delta